MKHRSSCSLPMSLSVVEQMENALDYLDCGVCLEVMVDPRTLPCGHTFCRGCLQKMIDAAGNLKCPFDTRLFSVPDSDAAKLMRNYQLNAVIASLGKSSNTQTIALPCSVHVGKEAKMLCDSCNKAMCADCVLQHIDHGILRPAKGTLETKPQSQLAPEGKSSADLMTASDEIEIKAFKVDGALNNPSSDIRRFSLKLTPQCFDSLKQKVGVEYETSIAPEIFWKDSDGDFVKITNNDGLKVAAKQAGVPFRVYVRFSLQLKPSPESHSESADVQQPVPTLVKQVTCQSVKRIAEQPVIEDSEDLEVGSAINESDSSEENCETEEQIKLLRNLGKLMSPNIVEVLKQAQKIINAGSRNNSNRQHPGIECDGCSGKVFGIRYKCQVCADFDFCQSCEATQLHPHPMQSIPPPQSWQPSTNASPPADTDTNAIDGTLHPRVKCDGCKEQLRGIRYKCPVCPDFDFCQSCKASRLHPHPLLSIVTTKSVESAYSDAKKQAGMKASHDPLHVGIKCDGCRGQVFGIRYKCQVCKDFDFCQSCKATRSHPHSMRAITLEVQSSSFDARRFLHVDVKCDKCGGAVRGQRYKCAVCNDFDLCDACWRQKAHTAHAMIVIRY